MSPVGPDQSRAVRDRLLLYLDGLGVPPERALILASEALRSAGDDQAVAMDRLRRLLPCEEGCSPEWSQIAPSILRGHMPPAEMELRPWRAFFGRLIEPLRLRAFEATNTRWLQYLEALAFLVLLNALGWRPL